MIKLSRIHLWNEISYNLREWIYDLYVETLYQITRNYTGINTYLINFVNSCRSDNESFILTLWNISSPKSVDVFMSSEL